MAKISSKSQSKNCLRKKKEKNKNNKYLIDMYFKSTLEKMQVL